MATLATRPLTLAGGWGATAARGAGKGGSGGSLPVTSQDRKSQGWEASPGPGGS